MYLTPPPKRSSTLVPLLLIAVIFGSLWVMVKLARDADDRDHAATTPVRAWMDEVFREP